MGIIRVAVLGMRGFWCCLGLCFVCAAVGIPILLIAIFRDQYTSYEFVWLRLCKSDATAAPLESKTL